jgi:hypothetical protein
VSNRSLIKNALTPPYRLLPLAVFAYAALCFILHPEGALRAGHLGDPDDYMRLNEVINWLQGQGWHDLSHPRLSPGSDTVVHWSRLLDIPLALLMLPFIESMGMQNAAMLASFIVPPLTFGLLLWLAVALARVFVGRERANLAAPLTLFAPLTLMNFAPGRVDHHGYEVLIAGFGLLCLERMAEDERHGGAYAIFAAIAFACGLWIGAEALPWAILFVACLAIMAAWQGGFLLRRAALFGVAFMAATASVLPLAVAPAGYGSLALSWFSLADVIFAALVAGVFIGGWLAGRMTDKRWMRLAFMAALGLLAAALFCAFVPEVGRGPFADYDDFDSTIALANIGEAQPLAHSLRINPYNMLQTKAALLSALQTLLLPVLAMAALVFAAIGATSRRRILLMAHGAFLAVSTALTLFWQMRVGWFMQFFALAPLTFLLVAWWDRIAARYAGRRRFWAEIAAFLALGFAPVVLIPAVVHDAPFLSDVVLFPAARPAPQCPLRAAVGFLAEPWGYGARKRTLLSGSNEGPELLFSTPHDVIAANFNVAGNEDVYNFFGARDDESARAIAKRWNADLVLVCRSFPLAYARIDHAHLGKSAFLSPVADGSLHLVSHPDHPTLIERLARGTPPDWLKPVEIPGDKDYLLYEVVSH